MISLVFAIKKQIFAYSTLILFKETFWVKINFVSFESLPIKWWRNHYRLIDEYIYKYDLQTTYLYCEVIHFQMNINKLIWMKLNLIWLMVQMIAACHALGFFYLTFPDKLSNSFIQHIYTGNLFYIYKKIICHEI